VSNLTNSYLPRSGSCSCTVFYTALMMIVVIVRVKPEKTAVNRGQPRFLAVSSVMQQRMFKNRKNRPTPRLTSVRAQQWVQDAAGRQHTRQLQRFAVPDAAIANSSLLCPVLPAPSVFPNLVGPTYDLVWRVLCAAAPCSSTRCARLRQEQGFPLLVPRTQHQPSFSSVDTPPLLFSPSLLFSSSPSFPPSPS